MPLIFNLRQYRWYIIGRWRIKKQIKQKSGLRIILGSGTTNYKGWIATDLPHFNILKSKDWQFFFKPNSIDNILAEHVLEHLTESQVKEVLSLAFNYLRPGGIFRIAVPDKNHPNPDYIEHVRPGGSGDGADDHKSFWEFKSLNSIALLCGYKTHLLEYADEQGTLITEKFTDDNGIILRSLSKGYKASIDNYSSLIIDLNK